MLQRPIYRFVLFAAISAIFLTLFSISVSPLHPYLNGDPHIFRVMGDAVRAGRPIYTDFFDHKGPVIFFIYALFPTKISLFWASVIWMAITLELLYRIGYLFYPDRKRIATGLLIYVGMSILLIADGSTVEEWDLPLMLLPIYLAMRVDPSTSRRRLAAYALAIGVCTGIVAMTRLNNCAPILGVTIYAVWWLWRNNRLKEMPGVLGAFILGAAVIIVPICLYFSSMGALGDMIYVSIVYNCKYKFGAYYRGYIHQLIVNTTRLLVCVALPAAIKIIKPGDTNRFVLFTSISAVSLLTLIQGDNIPHYYLLILPLIYLLWLELGGLQWRNRRKWIAGVMLVVLLPYSTTISARYPVVEENLKLSFSQQAVMRQAAVDKGVDALLAPIPDAEIDSVYMLEMWWYCDILSRRGALPVGRYFFAQEWPMAFDSNACDDIRRHFIEANPRWVISNIPMGDSQALNLYADKYELVTEASGTSFDNTNYNHMRLYRRR